MKMVSEQMILLVPQRMLAAVLIFFTFNFCNSQNQINEQYQMIRQEMVESQLKSRGINNKGVLNAMLKVERRLFVSHELANQAYSDNPLPIGEGQTISQPYIVALMTQLLGVKSSSRVLEVGTGSGYQTAILAEICDSVFSIEIYQSLSIKAENLLKILGYSNVIIKNGDGYDGWEEYSPFDGIIVTCAPTQIPEPLIKQLSEGGRMIIPVGETYKQELILLKKINGKIREKEIVPVRFVPMISPTGKKY
jgi:protein-L-isoaspartate(D-aspartate) O-methyltransferase